MEDIVDWTGSVRGEARLRSHQGERMDSRTERVVKLFLGLDALIILPVVTPSGRVRLKTAEEVLGWSALT